MKLIIILLLLLLLLIVKDYVAFMEASWQTKGWTPYSAVKTTNKDHMVN